MMLRRRRVDCTFGFTSEGEKRRDRGEHPVGATIWIIRIGSRFASVALALCNVCAEAQRAVIALIANSLQQQTGTTTQTSETR